MDFRSLRDSLDLPMGTGDRYRTLEALERMQDSTLYDDLKYAFHEEKSNGRSYIPLAERRPSHDFCLAHELTQDTLAELFGDEQFPTVRVMNEDDQNDPATKAMSDLIMALDLDAVMAEAYEAGVIGAVGVIVHRSDNGAPYYEVCPAKWCEPQYRSAYSNELIGLVVTYPITREVCLAMFPAVAKRKENLSAQNFWYRRSVDPESIIEYEPLSEVLYAKLGEKDNEGREITFVKHREAKHGFFPRAPVAYTKNLGGKQRALDGPCLWWPIRNICIQIDYGLSEAGRGLRYAADPMLFLKKSGIAAAIDGGDDGMALGYEAQKEAQAAAVGASALVTDDGAPVRGAPQTIVGEDAKMLEISAQGIKEKREFVRDLREYALEIVGGMKARAEHLKAAPSGVALDKGLKPLRRLVRRQRRPYGDNLLLALLDLTLYGFARNALDSKPLAHEVNVSAIPADPLMMCDWPKDDVLQGAELLAHVQGLQQAAGGSALNPLQLIKPDAVGAMLSADLGFKEPYDTIKGSAESQQVADAPALADAAPDPVAPKIVKP
jgi:hypothetical protein